MHEVMKKGIWVGIEAEGPHQGRQTLFIMGEISWDRIDQVLEEHFTTSEALNLAFYFGAGRNPKFDPEALKRAVEDGFRFHPITLEIRDENTLSKIDPYTRTKIEVVRVFTQKLHTTDSFDRVKIEFEDPIRSCVQLFNPVQILVVNLLNPLLPGDKLLWAVMKEEEDV